MNMRILIDKSAINDGEDPNTTLLRELQDFNQVPLTNEDREEIMILSEIHERNRIDEQTVIAHVLQDAGVNIYAVSE